VPSLGLRANVASWYDTDIRTTQRSSHQAQFHRALHSQFDLTQLISGDRTSKTPNRRWKTTRIPGKLPRKSITGSRRHPAESASVPTSLMPKGVEHFDSRGWRRPNTRSACRPHRCRKALSTDSRGRRSIRTAVRFSQGRPRIAGRRRFLRPLGDGEYAVRCGAHRFRKPNLQGIQAILGRPHILRSLTLASFRERARVLPQDKRTSSFASTNTRVIRSLTLALYVRRRAAGAAIA
jgi:hypothetical protein